jgi:D-alanyl-D-alanine carboxypeptidase/D-alanyl-D-alanine-endopeptidase (penicillin-binding protein 4)
MRKLIHSFTLAICLLAPSGLIAQSDTIATDSAALSWGEALCLRIDSAVQVAESDHFFTGVCVYDLTGDSMLYTHNAHKLLRPASTQKVLTAVAALDVLGARHKHETKAYHTGHISKTDSTLHGDIYIVGGFDPAYTYSDLKGLARHIKALGINRIEGRIMGDVSMKDSTTMGNGWCWDDVPSAVEAYLSPLTFNRGCAAVQIVDGKAKFAVPTTYMTLADSTKAKSGRLKAVRNWVDNGNHFTVTGSPTRNAVSSPISVYRPELYFVCTLADLLKSNGVEFANGHTNDYGIAELTDSTAQNFYTCSRTVEQILQKMMKDSDNLYAESMFYQLAHTRAGKGATYNDGAVMVDSVMRIAGIPARERKIADGSGVSLYNYTTAWAEVAMLRYAHRHHERIFRHLYHALPIAGVDGTLEKRMKKTAAETNVRAKTGTVTGVSCLTGYCKAANGNLLAFSIMNNGLYKASIGRDFQDILCPILAE